LSLACSAGAIAQEEDAQVDPNSLLRIPRYEHLYKSRVWRNLDLSEKQNKGFFARGNEITKLILDGVASGELADVYERDSLTTKIPKDVFFASLVAQQGATFDAWDPARDWYAGDNVTYNGKNYSAIVDSKGKNPETSPDDWQVTTAGKAVTFLPSEIYRMVLMEDVIFDKRRSRLYYDIIAIQLLAFDNNTSTFKPLGWFKYKDLEKLFRNHPKEAVWFNRYNPAENKNYADAFLLRLFKGSLDKIENPDDSRIFDIYPNYKLAVFATEWEEMKMMEKEHNLWEY